MSTKLLNGTAGLFMLLAIALVAVAIFATTRRSEIQGPSALAVLPDRSVWLSVEDALWHLDEHGKRVAVADAATLGVGGRIGNLVVHPNGQLVAQVRNDPALYFLDPQTGIIQSRLVPQWQPDLERDGSDAINYAFHDDGRVAIATGGGHAVALFDAKGAFLARTKPGTYVFTNGLWWQGDNLWTTDTNRQELVELDGSTLAEKLRIKLSMHTSDWQFLGMAVPSHGIESIRTHTHPLATLIRFAYDMTKGHATDVFADGSQIDYPVTDTLEPRDIKWRDNELMMVDNYSFSIKRYSDNHKHLPDFGDAQVQAELKASLNNRLKLELKYYASLSGAILLVLIGLGLAWRAHSREKTNALAAMNIDLSQLGTPVLSAFAIFMAVIKLAWPMLLAIGALAAIPHFSGYIAGVAGLTPRQTGALGLVLVQLICILIALLLRRIIQHSQQDPTTEAIFNNKAVQLLQTDLTFWKLCQPGELPQETLMLNKSNWLVLTNHRLLVFVSNLRDRTLISEYSRRDISRLHFLELGKTTWRQKLLRFFSPVGALVRLEFKGGTSLEGNVISVHTARRVATQLQVAAQTVLTIDDMHQMQLEQAMPRLAAKRIKDSNRHAIASLAIPGLGQWMQRRTSTAFYFFLAWLSALSTAIPVAWTLWTRLSSISTPLILFAASAYIFICVLASLDAWNMRERYSPDDR